MEIVIVAGGMPFGPRTLDVMSLGGSETAAINMARSLRKLDNLVTIFCNLPEEGRPDHVPGGGCLDDLGIRWCSLAQFEPFITSTEVDLLVVSRQFEFFQINHQAKHAVLWAHDLATWTYTQPKIVEISWNFNEVWVVSEFHKTQFAEITGYPKDRIWVTRNGITPIETMDMGRGEKELIYAARPERGLIHLVKEGGIMERLPEFRLTVSMYNNFPPHLQGLYDYCMKRMQELPNVEFAGFLTQSDLRQRIRNSWLYVYPTDFEEVSCILAREAISVGTPIVTTDAGALPETVGKCGYLLPANGIGTPEWYDDFVAAVRTGAQLDNWYPLFEKCQSRTDLDWNGVAASWIERYNDRNLGSTYNRALSLIKDSDIIPAMALLNGYGFTKGDHRLLEQLTTLYPYLVGTETFEEYYERYFKREDEKGARWHPHMRGDQRFEHIAGEVGNLPDGSVILDYGCAEGVIILDLAERFPNKKFVGVDFAASNIELCKKFALERELKNVDFLHASSTAWPDGLNGFDAAICSEVLEHVTEPWALCDFLEQQVKLGGRLIITVPQGPWEQSGLYDPKQWYWRAHIWHINKWMLRQMFKDKKNCRMSYLAMGHYRDGRAMGHLFYTYETDMVPVNPVNPIDKAFEARVRQSVAACVISDGNTETIERMLNSLSVIVDTIKVAFAKGKQARALKLLKEWSSNHPWVNVEYVNVPVIEVKKFGFDDARNESTKKVEEDWILWIDTDEYLSGNPQPYLKDSAIDSYSIQQHHFSVDPPGNVQIDKPARLYRNDGNFRFYGKVHEHAERGFNKGPGWTFILPTINIGHTGYVDEGVRRSRFHRNFPFLEWDREVNPERRLGKFLWLRDIIHRMRYAASNRDMENARRLGEEAVDFYRTQWEAFDDFGMGGVNALMYHSEALAFLGRGVNVAINLQLENMPGQFQGRFESPAEVWKVLGKQLENEFKRRQSKYWG